jgi:BirA family biotin operon repressor/biotin-[acetyl-CoA-carboxylase] ligase
MTLPGESRVGAALRRETARRIARLEMLGTVDSTNACVMDGDPPVEHYWHVAIADEQTAGRGRGGKRWRSGPGAGLWMSAAYTFETPPARLSSLTLVLGAVIAAELESIGLDRIQLKWPNDLVVDGYKLGGILVESKAGGRTVVCGIGINLETPRVSDDDMPLEPIGLNALLAEPPSRDALAVRVLQSIVDAVPVFASGGFAPFRERWSAYDWLLGREVSVSGIEPAISGVASGIHDDGTLRIRDGSVDHRVAAGTVRLADRRTRR